jgi:O-antigen ligase
VPVNEGAVRAPTAESLILLLVLIFAAGTIWVRERWALSILEGVVFLATAATAVRSFGRPSVSSFRFVLIAFIGMAAWGLIQLNAGWTVVGADTRDAVLYWLAAACLVQLGYGVSTNNRVREWFLKACTIAGSAISFIGLISFFTSGGLVFWLFPSGYESAIPAPFVSRNNYAAFVELLVPVALFLALRRRPTGSGYLVLAAMLLAAVIGCASRAGAVLVIAETTVVFFLAKQRRAALAAFAVVSTVFVVIVGYQYVWERFTHDSDPFLLRREVLESTMAMVRAQPLHGFGLGAWTSAYPQFAALDVGSFVNHAHNEWAQWAAEGGLPAFAAMLAVFAWTLRATVRSIWGIGLVAVMIHALVDYPFMRLGLAAWIFVLLGVLDASHRKSCSRQAPNPILVRSLAAASVPVLLFSAFYTIKLGWADSLYRRGTLDSLQRAVRVEPGRAEYQLSLAQADSDHSIQYLERAVAVNPSASNASIQLATEWEAAGERVRAERVLLEAARHDRQFAPAWALANFYFRSGQPEKVWPWAAAAVKVYRGNLRPLFELCFLASNNAGPVVDAIVAGQPAAERQLLSYLLEHRLLSDAQSMALRIAKRATSDDRDVLLDEVDLQLASGSATAAWEIWQQLCGGLVKCDVGPPGLSNGDFRWPVLKRGFDWLLPSVPGVTVAQIRDGASELSLSFSGKEPEACVLLGHFVPLRAGERYTMSFEYRTTGLPPHTGLYWSAGTDPGYRFDSMENWTAARWSFRSTGETGRLSLSYRRYPGTTRIDGVVFLRKVRLEREASPHTG